MYKKYNAENILNEVEKAIDELEHTTIKWYYIDKVYNRFSIFDWWNDRLRITHLKNMRSFLREAIKLGYTGYVCFKVGASGCSNGMWAHIEESTNGYSPDGDYLYRSFSPDYTYWGFNKDGVNHPRGNDMHYDSLHTIKKLEDYIKSL